MRPCEAWKLVRKLAESRYQHNLPGTPDDCFELNFGRVAALRDVCICTGIVLERKNYDIFDSLTSESSDALPFVPENILDIQAIPKHVALPNR